MSTSVSIKTDHNHSIINPIFRWFWFTIALLTLILTYHQTFVSVVNIWSRSDTFAHGFLVIPIVVFLIWKQRIILSQTVFKTDPIALAALLLFSGMWFIGHALTIVVVEQFAAVALIPMLIWFIFGKNVLNVLAFPLGFLFFTVPIGEELVYPLMQITAFFTVSLLKLTDIPVYSDGTFFSIPSGDWSVVTACSGIRYLIASIFLGVLYAHFFYRTWWRRGLFVLLSIIVPILANGVRAYLIVMIAHWTDMQFAIGVDHLIYGWVFFGLVMFLLFAVGHLWTESPLKTSNISPDSIASNQPCFLFKNVYSSGFNSIRNVTKQQVIYWIKVNSLLSISLLVLLAFPTLDRTIVTPTNDNSTPLILPTGQAGWLNVDNTLIAWTPHYLNTTQLERQSYRKDNDQVELFIVFYANQTGELINSENVLVPEKNAYWRMPKQYQHIVEIAGEQRAVVESQLQSATSQWLIWHWYWVNGTVTTSAIHAKLAAAFAVLSHQPRREAAIIIATPFSEKAHINLARIQLEMFATSMFQSIDLRLRATISPGEN